MKNLAIDLDDFKRFVIHKLSSLRGYLEAEKHIMYDRNNTKVPRKDVIDATAQRQL